LTAPIASLGSATAVRPIKNIAPPIINPGNRLARSDKGNPKNHFKNHVNALQYISEKWSSEENQGLFSIGPDHNHPV
jgi:hypothetical protein